MTERAKPPDRQYEFFSLQEIEAAASHLELPQIESVSRVLKCPDRVVLLPQTSETARKVRLKFSDHPDVILKEVPWYCTDASHRFLQAWLEREFHLIGLPLPSLLGPEGHPFVNVGGSWFGARDVVVGYRWKASASQLRAVGALLAQWSRVAATRTDWPAGSHQTSIWKELQQHANLVDQQLDLSQPDRSALDRIKSFAFQHEPRTSDMVASVVHGDLIPWNLAFGREGEVVAIYDTDNCAVDTRLHDIAEAITATCYLDFDGPSSRLKQWKPPVSKAAAVELILGSMSDRGLELSQLERTTLPLAVISIWWECLLLSVVRLEQKPGILADAVHDVPRRVSIDWAVVEPDVVVEV